MSAGKVYPVGYGDWIKREVVLGELRQLAVNGIEAGEPPLWPIHVIRLIDRLREQEAAMGSDPRDTLIGELRHEVGVERRLLVELNKGPQWPHRRLTILDARAILEALRAAQDRDEKGGG